MEKSKIIGQRIVDVSQRRIRRPNHGGSVVHVEAILLENGRLDFDVAECEDEYAVTAALFKHKQRSTGKARVVLKLTLREARALAIHTRAKIHEHDFHTPRDYEAAQEAVRKLNAALGTAEQEAHMRGYGRKEK